MDARQTLPDLWLLSDLRNDSGLEAALARLPAGSGFVFRHYHLEPAARRARFEVLRRIGRDRGHCLVLADDGELAASWGADGIYAAPERLPASGGGLILATVHDAAEIAMARARGADAMFLSPVFPTRSHRGAPALGKEGFLALARGVDRPVIALGGMNAQRAAELGWPRWGAIDGLS